MKNTKKRNLFEKHKITSLILIIITTILITRAITAIKDPNIIIKGYELHHFYYGLILLIITSLLMLYKRGDFKLHLILTAISMGLIIDELFFIFGKIRGPITYASTLPSTVVLTIIIFVITVLINHIAKK